MSHATADKEQKRLALQASLDAAKTQAERNRLGQFATPTPLAGDILQYAKTLLPRATQVRFIDPAIGTGAFYSALLKVFPKQRIAEAVGFELDPHYGRPAAQLWSDTGLTLELADFTHAEPSPRFNVLICNPPYVRHHHLNNGEKTRLQVRTRQASGVKISGLSGLYCHFLGLSHAWMAEGGVAGWLIPSEFMDVNYGQAVKRYLLERVTLLHIHRFDPNDVQFADALVSSAIVWFRNEAPPAGHEVNFTFGGTLFEPRLSRHVSARALAREAKWTRFPVADVRSEDDVPTLSAFFQIKRGLATGDNSYFILAEEEIAARGLPTEVFTPILPSPRYLQHDEVKPRKDGAPSMSCRRARCSARGECTEADCTNWSRENSATCLRRSCKPYCRMRVSRRKKGNSGSSPKCEEQHRRKVESCASPPPPRPTLPGNGHRHGCLLRRAVTWQVHHNCEYTKGQ